MLTDANKSTLDLLALNLCDERRQGRWAEGAKVDLAEWDWRKPPPRCATMIPFQLIRLIGAEGLDRRGPVGSCRLFLGPGFRLGARWNRAVETVKTRKKRGKTGEKWARYGLKRVKVGG